MINAKHIIDGFKIIIGGFMLNLCMFLTLIISVRPPDFEDEELTRSAKIIFGSLIPYHLILGFVRYWSMFFGNELRAVISMVMLLVVIVITTISQQWVYPTDFDPMTLNESQCHFYGWMKIEVAFFYSTLVSACLYIFINTMISVKLRFESDYTGGESDVDVDFLDVHSILIDMFSMIVASPSINMFLSSGVAPHCIALESVGDLTTVNWISLVQIGFFVIGLFLGRGSIYSRPFTLKIMPSIGFWAMIISMIGLPLVNIVISIV